MVTPAHKPKYIMKEYNPISCRLKKKKTINFAILVLAWIGVLKTIGSCIIFVLLDR
jgi:uncharacterized membrane protein